MKLLFSNKVSVAFADKVKSMFSAFPDWLMFIMGFETGWTFSPTAVNSASQAIGLIQFLPSTAQWLGTSVQALKAMSGEEQLYWVKKYLDAMQSEYGRFASYEDLYFAIFYPYAIGQNDNYILGSQDGSQKVQVIALQNKGFDANKDSAITKLEVKQWLNKIVKDKVPEEYWPAFFKKKTSFLFIKPKLSLAA